LPTASTATVRSTASTSGELTEERWQEYLPTIPGRWGKGLGFGMFVSGVGDTEWGRAWAARMQQHSLTRSAWAAFGNMAFNIMAFNIDVRHVHRSGRLDRARNRARPTASGAMCSPSTAGRPPPARSVRRPRDRHRRRRVLRHVRGPGERDSLRPRIVDAGVSAHLQVRAGLHIGEVETLADKVAGVAVHIGARVMAHAAGGEVLVSSTVKDIVAGSGISFEDRSTTEPKGVPGEWRLFLVAGVE
jgi:hypothetical protein